MRGCRCEGVITCRRDEGVAEGNEEVKESKKERQGKRRKDVKK